MKIKINNGFNKDYGILRKRVCDILFDVYAHKYGIKMTSFQVYKIKVKSFSVEFIARYDVEHKKVVKEFSYCCKIIAHFAVKDDMSSIYKFELLESSKRNNDDDIYLQDELESEELYFWVPNYYELKKDNFN